MPIEVWAKPRADGSKAVGIFNRLSNPLSATVDLRTLGFSSPVKARDLWRKSDLGTLASPYSATSSGHGVILLKVWQ